MNVRLFSTNNVPVGFSDNLSDSRSTQVVDPTTYSLSMCVCAVDAVFHNLLIYPANEIALFTLERTTTGKAVVSQRRGCNDPPKHHSSVEEGDMSRSCVADYHRIQRTLQVLETSGYYYPGLSWRQATELLQNTTVGTFLVRESSDSEFLFTLSVNTERGPTSVRIHYTEGQFRLDSEDSIADFMPVFDCVVQLVEYYIRLSQSSKGSSCVWLDNTGRRDLPILLCRPLYHHILPLKHMCRLTVNDRLRTHTDWISESMLKKLRLPHTLVTYLREYPYPH